MYEKDKRQRITLRLSDEQFNAVKTKCEVLGITPSDFIRMLINAVVYSDRKIAQPITEEVLGRENDKAIKHD